MVQAAIVGDLLEVKRILDTDVSVDIKDEFGRTALTVSSGCGHENIVKCLIDKSVDVNASGQDGLTSLMLAILNNRPIIVDLLIKNKADVEKTDNDGQSALMSAARRGLSQYVKVLLENKCDIKLRDNINKLTATDWAFVNNHHDVVELLTQAGVGVSTEGKNMKAVKGRVDHFLYVSIYIINYYLL